MLVSVDKRPGPQVPVRIPHKLEKNIIILLKFASNDYSLNLYSETNASASSILVKFEPRGLRPLLRTESSESKRVGI